MKRIHMILITFISLTLGGLISMIIFGVTFKVMVASTITLMIGYLMGIFQPNKKNF